MSTNRKDALRDKAGLKAAAALQKACKAMNAYMAACRNSGEPLKGLDDSRILLVETMSEYEYHLSSRHEKKGGPE